MIPDAIKTLQMDSIDVELWYQDKFRWILFLINAVFGVSNTKCIIHFIFDI